MIINYIVRTLVGLAIILVMVNIIRANVKSYEESHVDKGKTFAQKVEKLHSKEQVAQ